MGVSIKERLSELMVQLNMTQKELAARACITQAAMSHYIKGDRVPNAETLANLATALRTTTDYLLGRDEMDDDFNYPQFQKILARNANSLTTEERQQLINVLFRGE